MADPTDIQRLIGDLSREGTVVSVDHATGTARVRFADDVTTGDIPWLSPRSGKTRVWAPPSVGEQVSVLSPEADTKRGVIIGSLSSDAHPHPARNSSTLMEFGDGAQIEYDPEAHMLRAVLPGGGLAHLEAESVVLRGTVYIQGSAFVSGQITVDGDVVGAGKSLKDHVHTGVQAGAAVSGKPQ